jgi:autotransporter-associated beta strand protein
MKSRILSTARLSFTLASAIAALLAAPATHADTYYWDDDDATAGFGTAGASTGTWAAPTAGTVAGWSLSATGENAFAPFTTATTDSINFGNGATGLAAGPITVSGTVDSGDMTFASGSGAIVLSGGTINLAAATIITVNNTTNTINSILAGAGTSLTKTGAGTLELTNTNTYTGQTTVTLGTLNASALDALGTGAPLLVNGGTLALSTFSSTVGAVTLTSGSITGTTSVLTGTSFALESGSISAILAGSGAALTKTTGGTVILSNTNTYTGDTTVNSGILKLSNAGALNHTAGNVTINNGGTVSTAVADCQNQEAVTVNTDGFLTATKDLANAYTGSTIYLDGGTLRYEATGVASPGNTINVGGTVVVRASSTLNPYGSSTAANNKIGTLVFGTLDFSADGYLLTVSKTGTPTNKPPYLTGKFVGSTISHSGTIGVNAARTYVELTDTAIRAGKTLTKTGAETFTVSGNLGVAMLGGAELMSANSFTLITAATTFTNTSTFGTSGGLWSVSGAASPVIATLANNAGTIAVDGSGANFAAEDAAYVSLTGLTNGTEYDLFLKLADPDKQATVMAQLAKNPVFSTITAYETDQVQFKFTATATTHYFAWDNFHTTGDWYLGGNLTYVGLSAWAPPTAKDCLWVGGSGDVKWSTATDWNQTPVATDTLIFGTPGGGGAILDNDIVGGSFGSLQFAVGAPAFTLNNNSVTLTGKGLDKVIIENNSGNNQIVNLPIVLGANGKIDAASGNIVVGGDISGDFGLIKTGTGTLTLSGTNNTYTGGTVINAGSLVISGSKLGTTTGGLTLGGSSLDLGTTSQTVGALSVTAAGIGDTLSNGSLTGTSYAVSNTTGEAVISANLLANGLAGLTKSGAGILTLSGSGNTYAGATTISGGTLKLGVADAIPHGVGRGDVALGGTLDLNGLIQTVNGLTGAGAVINGNSTAAILKVGDANSVSNFPGAIQDGTGTVALEKIGTGTVILSGTNGYTAGTTVSAGTLQFNSAAAIGGTARNVTVDALGTAAFGPAFGAIQSTLKDRIVNTSPGTLALMAASGEDLDFSSTGADLTTASLGSVGAVAYSGTLTPNGTTYRLGGGGGTLTVSSSTLTGDNTLVVTGPGIVNLFGTNTFNGATTVNSGMLKLSNAGALNHNAGNVTINNGGTVSSAVAGCLDQEAVTVNTGGSLTSTQNLANAYTGSTIYLDGGTLRFDASGAAAPGNTINVGGTVVVRASSTLNPYCSTNNDNRIGTLVFGTLDFTADGYLLTVSTGPPVTKPPYLTGKFVGSTITHSATIAVNDTKALVELNNTAIRAGKTLNKTGAQAFTVSGNLGVAMLGGAELLDANSFTMVTAAGTFTNTSAFDTSDGLWSVSGATSPVTATLANSMGSITDGGSATFAAEDAGHVILTGLTVSTTYPLTLTLASAGDQATVMTQLAKNPAFSSIAADGADKISLQFTAPAETSYFAWDNVHTTAADWYLGGNLTGVVLGTYVATPYQTWATTGSFTNPFTNTLPGVDFDNDGLSNLLEFVLGGDPTISQADIAPTVSTSGGNLVMTFKRSDASELAPAVTVKVELSTDLSFSTPADDITIGPATDAGPIAPSGASYTVSNSGGFDTIVLTIPQGAAPKNFARIKAIQP